MDWLTDPNAWIGLLTLTVLEIVLGVDNIIFISILAGKLPEDQRAEGATTRLVRRVLLADSAAAEHRLGRAPDDAAVHGARRRRYRDADSS